MMRTVLLLAAVWLLHSNRVTAQSSILGPPPKINLEPVDTSRAMTPTTSTINNSLSAPRVRSNNFFSKQNFFPTISLASWPPKIPNVFALSQKDNPYQPVAPKGTNPFVSAPTTSSRPGSVISIPGKVVTPTTPKK